MKPFNRREFLHTTTLAALAGGTLLARWAPAEAAPRRKMTIDLVCGNIGVSANQREAIDLAIRYGFESVGADGGFLASLSDEQLAELKSAMKSVVFGAAGLPVEFRRDEARFEADLKGLPKVATGLQRAGVTRVTTWLMPCDDSLT
jgi:hypothetical protein